MRFLVWVLLCLTARLTKIEANLEIITYDPLALNLTFTQALPRPQFQLLFNQIPIKYEALPSEKTVKAKTFIITGDREGLANVSDYLTEKYVIMFTEPLNIAQGGLNLDSFLLRAHRSRNTTEYTLNPVKEKPSHYKYQNFDETLNALAIAICILVYFLAYTTLIGLNAYNFLAIYIYISLKSSLFTALDYKIAYYFLFDVHELEQDHALEVIYFLIPYMCLGLTLIIGLLSRLMLKRLANSSGLCNYVYYYLTYRIFIITWEIMCLPLFANTAHILYEKGDMDIGHWQKYILAYFNILVMAFYLYMSYFAANPQLGESLQKWTQYSATSHFQLFEGFHLGIEPQSRSKRNYQFIYNCLKMMIMILVTTASTQIPNIVLQVSLFIYLFTVRPFRYNFFNNFYIGIQALIVIFYLYRYIIELYVGISQEIATSTDMARILLTNIIFICILVLTYFVLGAYELYQRVRVFKINMNAWKRQSQYGDHEIRRTKRSAFEREKEQPKKDQENNQKKQADGSGRKNKQIKKTEKETKRQRMIQRDKQKQGKMLKEKSSLLQSISLGIESPR